MNFTCAPKLFFDDFITFADRSMDYLNLVNGAHYYRHKKGYLAYYKLAFNCYAVISLPLSDPHDYQNIIFDFLNAFPFTTFYAIPAEIAFLLMNHSFTVTPFASEHYFSLQTTSYNLFSSSYLKDAWRHQTSFKFVWQDYHSLPLDERIHLDRSWFNKFRHKETYDFLIRRPPTGVEKDVCCLAAYKDHRLVAYQLFDPLYKKSVIKGYHASLLRFYRQEPYVSSLLLMHAFFYFKKLGYHSLSLGILPFANLPIFPNFYSLLFSFLSFLNYPYSFKNVLNHRLHFKASSFLHYIAFPKSFSFRSLTAAWIKMRS